MLELNYVRCDKCGNDKDFDVVVRYQRRKFNYELDGYGVYGGQSKKYWPDKILDDTIITCRECKRSLTYKAARECYDFDAEKMGQSLLFPSKPLPIVSTRVHNSSPATSSYNIFAPSEFAYSIQIPGGISDRAVDSGFSVSFGNMGNPEHMQAKQVAVYYRNDIAPAGSEYGSKFNLSVHPLGDDKGATVSYEDFISPKISPEQIKRVSDIIYNKINMEMVESSDFDFLSGDQPASYDDTVAERAAGFRYNAYKFPYNSQYIEMAFRFASEYEKHHEAGHKFRQTIASPWTGGLYLDVDGVPFLVYTGHRPLKKMPTTFQGMRVYFSEYSIEYNISSENTPQAAFSSKGFTHSFRKSFEIDDLVGEE